ncbi:MAG: hypothetical protein IKG37_04225 [Solobacterium sp.]|nr:hypothetical protein [Solobacterium sp.]
MSENDQVEMKTALEKVKVAMRRAGVNAGLDGEITDLIESCMADLGIAGVNGAKAIITDPLIRLAYITFCKLHNGEPDEYDRLKRSYDEQKAQLSMSTGYTVWTTEVTDG